jgi:hypothetical protein
MLILFRSAEQTPEDQQMSSCGTADVDVEAVILKLEDAANWLLAVVVDLGEKLVRSVGMLAAKTSRTDESSCNDDLLLEVEG